MPQQPKSHTGKGQREFGKREDAILLEYTESVKWIRAIWLARITSVFASISGILYYTIKEQLFFMPLALIPILPFIDIAFLFPTLPFINIAMRFETLFQDHDESKRIKHSIIFWHEFHDFFDGTSTKATWKKYIGNVITSPLTLILMPFCSQTPSVTTIEEIFDKSHKDFRKWFLCKTLHFRKGIYMIVLFIILVAVFSLRVLFGILSVDTPADHNATAHAVVCPTHWVQETIKS